MTPSKEFLALILFPATALYCSDMYGIYSVLIAWSVLVVLFCAAVYIVGRMEYVQELRRYAQQTENIYIMSESPEDTQVFLRAEYSRNKLIESGNALNVEVHELYYRDPRYSVVEDWSQFLYRADLFIQSDRQKRALFLNHNRKDRILPEYKKFILKQQGI